MSDIPHVPLRDLIEEQFKRRDDQRISDREWFTSQFTSLRDTFDASAASVEKATQLLAKTYPTTDDFNDLKEHVDKSLSEGVGKTKGYMAVLSFVTAASFIMSLIVAILAYNKGIVT